MALKRSSNSFDYLLAISLVFLYMGYYASSFSSHLLREPYANLVMRAASLGIISLVFILRLLTNRASFQRNIGVMAFLLFFGIYTVRLILHLYDGTDMRLTQVDYVTYYVIFMLLPILCAFTLTPTQEKLTTIMMFYMSIVFLLLALFVRQSQVFGSFRLTANDFLDPISTGVMACVACIAALKYPRQTRFAVVMRFSVFALAAGMVVASGSRGPLIALILIIVIYLSTAIKKKNLFFAVLPLMMVFGYMLFNYSGNLSESIYTINRFEDATRNGTESEIRFEIYSSTIRQFLESPAWGTSIDLRDFDTYPHNLILESLMSTGMLGGMFFIISILYALYCVFLDRKRMDLFQLLFILFLSQAQFSGSLLTSPYFMGALLYVLVKGARTPEAITSRHLTREIKGVDAA